MSPSNHRCGNFPRVFVTSGDIEGSDGYCPWCRSWPAGEFRPAPGAKWSGEGGKDKPVKGLYKAPANVGDAFYKALQKAGYIREGTQGDYR